MGNDYGEKAYRNGEVLKELHHEQKKTLPEIAELFDVSVSTIWTWAQRNDIETSRQEDPEERFHERYEIDSETGCWEWTAGAHENGYGYISVEGDNMGAHRLSYQLHKGEIPEGALICHRCHNPSCVNPDHLYAGDESSNAQDAIDNDDWPDMKETGLQNSPLTEDMVREMRELYATGDVTYSDLSERFDVAMATVSRVITGEGWDHVDGAIDFDWRERSARKGSDNGVSKLTEDDVREIRDTYEREDITMAELGDRYDISSTNVSDIVNRNRWKHVE